MIYYSDIAQITVCTDNYLCFSW